MGGLEDLVTSFSTIVLSLSYLLLYSNADLSVAISQTLACIVYTTECLFLSHIMLLLIIG